MRRPWLRSLLLGATNGLFAAFAGTVPLSFGLAITQLPVQAVVGACVLVGCVVGWFGPTGWALLLILVASGMTSFAIALEVIRLLYPPQLLG